MVECGVVCDAYLPAVGWWWSWDNQDLETNYCKRQNRKESVRMVALNTIGQPRACF